MGGRAPRDLYAGKHEGPEAPFPIRLRGPVIKGFGRGSRELGIPTANIPPSGLAAYPELQSGVYFGFVGLELRPDTVQRADNSKLTLSQSATTASAAAAAAPATGAESEDTTTTTTTTTTTATTAAARPPSASRAETTTTAPDAASVSIYPAVLSIGYNPFYSNPTRSIEIHVLHHFPAFNFYHSPLNLLLLGFIRPEYDYESLAALVDDIKTDCEVARRSLERGTYRRWMAEEWLREFGWAEGVDWRREEREVLRGDKGGMEEEGKL